MILLIVELADNLPLVVPPFSKTFIIEKSALEHVAEALLRFLCFSNLVAELHYSFSRLLSPTIPAITLNDKPSTPVPSSSNIVLDHHPSPVPRR